MKLFTHGGRPKYGKVLEKLLSRMEVENVLALSYDMDTKGSVRVDFETKKDGVYSISYEYGNLDFSEDNWSGKSEDTIMNELLNTSIHFSTLQEYYVWRSMELFEI